MGEDELECGYQNDEPLGNSPCHRMTREITISNLQLSKSKEAKGPAL